MQDTFPQPSIVSFQVVSRANDGEILVIALNDHGLPYVWDRAHGTWMPWADEQKKYAKFGEEGKVVPGDMS